jgi:hypothetical protein
MDSTRLTRLPQPPDLLDPPQIRNQPVKRPAPGHPSQHRPQPRTALLIHVAPPGGLQLLWGGEAAAIDEWERGRQRKGVAWASRWAEQARGEPAAALPTSIGNWALCGFVHPSFFYLRETES